MPAKRVTTDPAGRWPLGGGVRGLSGRTPLLTILAIRPAAGHPGPARAPRRRARPVRTRPRRQAARYATESNGPGGACPRWPPSPAIRMRVMAPAGDPTAGRGFHLFHSRAPLRKEHRDDRSADPGHPGRIRALLDHARRSHRGAASRADRLPRTQGQPALRIAADLDTTEAHQVAAVAWHYADLAALRRAGSREEAPR